VVAQANLYSARFPSQPHPWCASVEKLDPGGLEGGGDLSQGLRPRLGGAAFKIGNRFLGDFAMLDEIFLGPVEKGAGGTALRGAERH
jgi:hypothetical protein